MAPNQKNKKKTSIIINLIKQQMIDKIIDSHAKSHGATSNQYDHIHIYAHFVTSGPVSAVLRSKMVSMHVSNEMPVMLVQCQRAKKYNKIQRLSQK